MFITDLDASEADRNIVRAIVAMGHSLGLRVIAEGIETESQRAFLVTCQCDVMQGYLYSRPLTAGDFARFLTLAATQPTVEVD
jgi:EAL domain-containing protein (putative c-di-GMP-specific phosphodiesterase class I)